MLALLFALVLAAPTFDTTGDPQTVLVVTFERSVTPQDAPGLIVRAVPEHQGIDTTFDPAVYSISLDTPPTSEEMEALFAGGAISVQTTRSAAQLWSLGADIDIAEFEARYSRFPPYNVEVELPGHWDYARGEALFASTFGDLQPSRTKTANEARITVPAAQAEVIRARLAALAGVVSVREDA